ncbi:class I mannose-6-phosphate isomerase [Gryllotalpicola koreensis]|uniref:Class I mannose-6-phosphate isomerase n=1 Tax=Gryllotalpicola koreensis TaxID=993086 RepID=A0ABP8A509_9MICO
MTHSPTPIRLPMNRPVPRPYRGGAGIERFRRQPPSGEEWAPEDFLASTVTTFGSAEEGLTRIDGTFLRELIQNDPIGFLGAEHVAWFGPDPKLLCKLLHTGERLFVHAHPDAEFARRELGAPTGKTEAWIILDVDETEAGAAWLGFAEDVSAERLAGWFETQDSAAMLAAMNRVELRRGDTLFVPAGVPHAIGAGVLLLELQEPADLSVIVEYAPFPRLSREDGLLGLDAATALSSIDRTAFSGERMGAAIGALPAARSGALFGADAEPFFRAEAFAVEPGTPTELRPQFAVLVVTDGEGSLEWAGGSLGAAAGDTVLVPHGAGGLRLAGELAGIRCMPPAPAA